ncbi:hypothetical protein H2O64_22650 [Kordia sp. YSTF-M3]|uniref:Uncharacterized protein n=1 Tax=Kordia aestuariivivens TaxID=2759037 RepID=A0ABR7QG71_9FLAO|nr:hypothetical protein [Kordia aestuariivivens]MBC8757488.1 hypothetical protein [Kordia aestuariivivens]
MTQEINNPLDNTLDDIDKVFAISGIALGSLELLFYPVEEIADASEADLGFVGTVSKVVSGLGLIGTVWSVGLLYGRQVDIHPLLKWVFVPLLVLDVILVTLLLAMLAIDTASVSKVGNLALKYIKPAVCSLGAIGIIIAMAVMPKKLLKMSFIGLAIHYLPAALGYAPINKHPFYVLVVFVRTGGLITALAGDAIELFSGEDDTDEQLQLES